MIINLKDKDGVILGSGVLEEENMQIPILRYGKIELVDIFCPNGIIGIDLPFADSLSTKTEIFVTSGDYVTFNTFPEITLV